MKTDTDTSSLLLLQSQIKRDPDGYQDEFQMQYRHYKAALSILLLNPGTESKEFMELVSFLSQVANLYPLIAVGFPEEIMGILSTQSTLLHPAVRKIMVQALLLLRNKGAISAEILLQMCFRLFSCSDKSLRQLLFSHIIQDIKRMNKIHRDEKLNRVLQNFLFSMVQDENETVAKKSLSVLIELYRRQIWTDSKTVNVICSACFHKATRIMVAAMKFFLGADRAQADSDGDSDGEPNPNNPIALDKEAVYKAFNKGTKTSKKKKQAKLKRVLYGLKKQQRRISSGGVSGQASFAALHLLNDPQGVVEKLFSRLRSSSETFEVKVMLMNLISRVVGAHKLLLLNFYPFLQKYIQPHQRDVTHLLATAVQACHDQVPPDAVEPLMRQLVNQFVHDRARPEVIAVGLNTIREMCSRMPLLMTEELLQDLAMYKKAREKPVVSAARSLIALFRELAPSLLEKKDRGKGTDLGLSLPAYGATAGVLDAIPGIELLGEKSESEDSDASSCSEGEEAGMDEDEEGGAVEAASDREAAEMDSEGSDTDMLESDCDASDAEFQAHSASDEEAAGHCSGAEDAEPAAGAAASMQGLSLRSLKKLAGQRRQEEQASEPAGSADGFLSTEDFQHIRRMQAKHAAEASLAKHGVNKGRNGKQMDGLAAAKGGENLSDKRVDPLDLEAKVKQRREKEQRLASVMAGREGREFMAKSALKQKKTGGLTNREKQRRKALPLGVHRQKMKARISGKKRGGKSNTQFRGKKAWKS